MIVRSTDQTFFNVFFKYLAGLSQGASTLFVYFFRSCINFISRIFLIYSDCSNKMEEPNELSLKEIHAYFVRNNYKVTNTQLVKHFRKYLTGSKISKWIDSSIRK